MCAHKFGHLTWSIILTYIFYLLKNMCILSISNFCYMQNDMCIFMLLLFIVASSQVHKENTGPFI